VRVAHARFGLLPSVAGTSLMRRLASHGASGVADRAGGARRVVGVVSGVIGARAVPPAGASQDGACVCPMRESGISRRSSGSGGCRDSLLMWQALRGGSGRCAREVRAGPSVVLLVRSLVTECPAAAPEGLERMVFRVGRGLSTVRCPSGNEGVAIGLISGAPCRPTGSGGGRGTVGGTAGAFLGV